MIHERKSRDGKVTIHRMSERELQAYLVQGKMLEHLCTIRSPSYCEIEEFEFVDSQFLRVFLTNNTSETWDLSSGEVLLKEDLDADLRSLDNRMLSELDFAFQIRRNFWRNFSRYMRKKLANTNLSKAQIAKRCGVSRKTLSSYCYAERLQNPCVITAHKIVLKLCSRSFSSEAA